MKTRTFLLISLTLNAGLLASVAFLSRQPGDFARDNAETEAPERIIMAPAQETGDLRFGPVYRATLSSREQDGRSELLNLEKGNRQFEPDFAVFNNSAEACVAWLRLTGMDVGAVIENKQTAGFVWYYTALTPCPSNTWESITAADVVVSEALGAVAEPKRKCIFAEKEASFYMFRTHEGNCGILRIPPLDECSEGVHLSYRFVTAPGGALVQARRTLTTLAGKRS